MPEPNTQSSPSALPAPTWPRELRRSQSAVTPGSSEGIRLPPISNLIHQVGLSRQPHGRSRDVEAWESCAASQTRDALTAFAENESSGSAAAKISLIRSTSNASSTADSHHNGALQPSSGSKRNAPLSQRRDPQLAKRAKLSRANSNVARLGGGDDVCIKTPPVGDVIKETDSDKENWSPVGHVRPQRRPRDEGAPDRRPLPSGPVGGLRERSTLRDTRGRASPSLFSTRANTTPARRGKDQGVEIFVDGTEQPEDPVSPDEDNEVERFMATGSASPRKREMEIVEGLLSLRRGAWTMR